MYLLVQLYKRNRFLILGSADEIQVFKNLSLHRQLASILFVSFKCN